MVNILILKFFLDKCKKCVILEWKNKNEKMELLKAREN